MTFTERSRWCAANVEIYTRAVKKWGALRHIAPMHILILTWGFTVKIGDPHVSHKEYTLDCMARCGDEKKLCYAFMDMISDMDREVCGHYHPDLDMVTQILPTRKDFEDAMAKQGFLKAIETSRRRTELLKAAINAVYGVHSAVIDKVIFNAPATIVIWANGEKTVVKCKEGEGYDPEKGLAMAIAKHALGNQGNYYDVFKKWVPKKEERPEHKWVRIPVQPAWNPNNPLDDDFDTYYLCSECHYDVTTPTPYCPECGAKMSVEES